jgi:hypothetical protein
LEKMEEIRLYSWLQINGSNSYVIPNSFTATYYPPGLSTNSGITYTGALQITSVDLGATYSTNMRMIRVSVKWPSGKVVRNRSMNTYVGANGLQNYIFN